jgi:hypothetical protein
MSYIYGAPSEDRNLTSYVYIYIYIYIYGRDFYWGFCFLKFPRLKSIMKGARFADVAAIQERVIAVLRSIKLVVIPA